MSVLVRLKQFLGASENVNCRDIWLARTLSSIQNGSRILDAGAGELRNKSLCTHLDYVSQDFCQYTGEGDGSGLQTKTWDTRQIDIVSDITEIPVPDESFDVVLCSEVFEHIRDPLAALKEFSRLLKPGGRLIVTAPFASLVHFAPYYFYSGFSRYWYENHMAACGFSIEELTPNGDWFSMLRQEMFRLPAMAKRYGDWHWPLAYMIAGIGSMYFLLRSQDKKSAEMACFGWHCIARKA